MNKDSTLRSASWRALLSGKNAVLALALTGGVCIQAINIYLATTILPTVVNDIGGLSLYSWNTTLFIVASIIGAAVSANLLQKGVHFAYLIAAALLFLGCLISASAFNMPTMLVGRFLQGAGGGIFLALGYAMVTLVFTEELWPRALALISGMWGVATLFGRAIGGVFAQYGIWRAAFACMLPILIIYTWFVFKALPSSLVNRNKTTLPIIQLAFLTLCVISVSIASITTQLGLQFFCLLFSIACLVLLVWQEKKSIHKLFPIDALRPASPLFMVLLTIFLLLISVSSEIFLPYFLQNLHALTPLLAGIIASIMAIGWALAEVYCAKFCGDAINKVIKLSPIAVLFGLAMLLFAVPQTSVASLQSISIIAFSLLLTGFGIGACWPHLTTLVFTCTPEKEQELAASSMTTIMMFASALGSALAGFIANFRGFNTSDSQIIVADTALWVFAIFSVIAALSIISARYIVKRT